MPKTTTIELELWGDKPVVFVVKDDYWFDTTTAFATHAEAVAFCEEYTAARVEAGQLPAADRRWVPMPTSGQWYYGTGEDGALDDTAFFLEVTAVPLGFDFAAWKLQTD